MADATDRYPARPRSAIAEPGHRPSEGIPVASCRPDPELEWPTGGTTAAEATNRADESHAGSVELLAAWG